MRYRKGDLCGLCEANPDRLIQEEEPAVFGDKWKSKQYPDGCPECPEGERFKRRHAGRGMCATHYQRDLKKKALEAAAGEVPQVKIERLVDTGETRDATESEIERGVASVLEDNEAPRHEEIVGSDDEPLICCGKKNSVLDDCGGPECDYRDRFDDGTRPEPGDDDSQVDSSEHYHDALMRQHSEALAAHFDIVARLEQTLAVYNELVDLGAQTSSAAKFSADRLREVGIGVELAPSLLPLGGDLDPEIRAMYGLRDSLEPLGRDAQIRVVRWATARFEIDRPLPVEESTHA